MAKLGQVQNFLKPAEDAMGFSAIVLSNSTVYLAGVISIDDQLNIVAPNDMAGQIDRVYDIIEQTLAKCGATFEHVVNEVVYTTDLAAFAEAGPIRRKRYQGHAFPAATAVQVSGLAIPGALIEIQITAELDGTEWSPHAPLAPPPAEP